MENTVVIGPCVVISRWLATEPEMQKEEAKPETPENESSSGEGFILELEKELLQLLHGLGIGPTARCAILNFVKKKVLESYQNGQQNPERKA